MNLLIEATQNQLHLHQIKFLSSLWTRIVCMTISHVQFTELKSSSVQDKVQTPVKPDTLKGVLDNYPAFHRKGT